jgi:hypothetical protein
MSIFKDSFKQGVKDQLSARQDALILRTPQTLQYYNSRNAWIRVTSSVNVNNDNGALAKKYVLQGGILDPSKKLRAGIGGPNSAYSNVSPDDKPYRLGIRPMPGITGVEIKSKSAYGSLREATINFQAWDIRQLEELELLYMRPGYSVMVEWGWSPYLNNNKSLNTAVNYIDDVLNGGVSKEDIWKKAFNQASKDGNYDSLYGFIKNYSWSARPDGGYDCTTTIISTGEILESLKTNYGAYDTALGSTGIFPSDSSITRPFEKNSSIQKSYAQNIIAGICNELYLIVSKQITEDKKADTYNGWNFFRFDLEVAGKDDDKSDFNDTAQIYITLKDFIDIMNKYVLIKDSASPNPKPVVELSLTEGDHMVSSPKTPGPLLCLGHPLQLSMDPTICLIKNKAWADPKSNLGLDEGLFDDFSTIKELMTNLGESYWYNDDYNTTQLGIIGNIYVNLAYIYSLVTSKEIESGDRKEKNDIAVFDFLKSLMSGISTSIGNVANFDVFTDPVDGKGRIIDINYTNPEGRNTSYDNAFIIETHNLKSTVRSYKLESQIFPEQSSIVAIGAQAKGGALGENNNTLIDFNQNLTDRVIPKKEAPTSESTQTDPKKEAEEKVKHLKESLDIVIDFINEIDPDWWESVGDYDVGEAAKYCNALKDIINFWTTYVKNDNKNRSLIPTKLSLELDGIGGIVIGNLFRIPEELLPRGYKGDGAGPTKIGYIVTGLGHSLQNNDWKTNIDAQFIILDEPKNDSSLSITEVADIVVLTSAIQSNEEQAIEIVKKKEEEEEQGGGNPPKRPLITGVGNADAMKLAGDALFDRHGGCKSRCSQGTYAIARGYTMALNGQSPDGRFGIGGTGDCWNAPTNRGCSCKSGGSGTGAGNAGDKVYRQNLVALGYTMTDLGTMTKSDLIKYISEIKTIGVIINYRSTVRVAKENDKNYANTYGHTQIYTGGVLNSSIRNKTKSNWASSFGHNYGLPFVYNSANSDSWETYLFTPPGTTSSTQSGGSPSRTSTSSTFDAKKVADAIFEAMDECGTGKNAIKTQLKKVLTQADWDGVVAAYGGRTVTCGLTSYSGGIRATLRDELNDNDWNEVVGIIQSKGIKWQ